tara:strand:- start:3684 stop:4343 length:660 start_codon:yes stop_codon:yes gene_type:complete
MSKHYFQNIPNIGYKNNLTTSVDRQNYIYAKNLFLRAKVRDDVSKEITFLNSYNIREGKRPQDIADELYGDPTLDWIVLTVANIINVRDEWPMTGKVLYDYCATKYGNELNDTAFYETKEVRDNQNRLILPGGKVVDSNFTIPDPDNPQITLSLGSSEPLVIGISNFLAETRNNEKKRNIKVMREEYLTMFLMDMRETLTYTKSSQFESRFLKNAHNPT